MLTIKADFNRLSEITLTDIYDEIGVYIMWSGKATVCPSYIGEGNVLKRFVKHLGKSWAARPLLGLVAVMQRGTEKERKWQAETVEKFLLFIAKETGRFPRNNTSGGKISGFKNILKRQRRNVFRVNLDISGYDPLLHPGRPRMPSSKHIILQYIDEEERWDIKHPWNRR